MNPQIRKLTVAMAIMIVSLLVMATYVQFWRAPELSNDARNRRDTYQSWGQDRGPIIVDGTEIALSEKNQAGDRYHRVYPEGPLYAAVTGYSAERIHVSTGLERVAASELDGSSNTFFAQRIKAMFTGKDPQGGAIQLTLNPQMQKAAFAALGDRRGAVVALDVKTGAIKALVSTPSFDPNLLTMEDGKTAQTNLETLQDDPRAPLVNRAISGNRYPPGSVFKIVTAAAALQANDLSPETVIDAPRELQLPGSTATIKNDGGAACGSGTVPFKEAFARSCNTVFAQMSMDLGQAAMQKQAADFGFGEDLATPLAVTPSIFPDTKSAPQLAQSGIGQFEVQVTPMQVALISAAVANQGKMMYPYLIESTADRDLVVRAKTAPRVWKQAISPQVAQQLTNMMVEVVNSGTGKRAAIKGIQVAGKTGTAETGRGGAHAWFTGFAPAGDPRYAVAVIVESEDGKAFHGGQVAAPIAAEVLKAGLR
ncbi:peptidoglycan D,D-transpeptidase FtsI family protein [Boudabousia marimammalium]|uniref:Uncharacterized protein n=1 Tax=Boudabousia marimammalium TaxID=156892 RepID=A0A1Q5PSJ3_9ACTO|nr:penicillin-binding transpeptidase domain-containing protein [Boudabousia marimammalium]OKL50547.1 hypothetical protein BM477_00835 [Boudabousia marimammalium]